MKLSQLPSDSQEDSTEDSVEMVARAQIEISEDNSAAELNKEPGFIAGMLFLSALIGALTFGGFQLSAWLEDEQRAPVKKIVVSGQRQFIDDAEIEQLVRRTQGGSFFAVDVEQTHLDVEALPWVYRASVRKRWPNGLEIYVVEQVPAAHWNGDLLLNQFGQIFQASAEDGALALPKLFGPGGSEQTALQGYLAMRSLLAGTDIEINELFLSERFGWNMQLNNGIKLNLGRKEFIDRFQRFIDLFPLLNKQEKSVDYVDLRYDTGLAVGWKAKVAGTLQES